MFVLFVKPNQKRCTLSFSKALTQGNFGTILKKQNKTKTFVHSFAAQQRHFLCREIMRSVTKTKSRKHETKRQQMSYLSVTFLEQDG